MAVTVLDDLVTRYVGPALVDAGFKRNRRRHWTITSTDRYAVVVQIRPYNMEHTMGFHVEWCALPPVLWDYRLEQSASFKPEFGQGIVNPRLAVPLRLVEDPQFNLDGSAIRTSLWEFDPNDVDGFGPAFRSILVGEAIPMWLSALNADGIMTILQSDAIKYSSYSRFSDQLSRIILSVDDGHPDDLERQIKDAERLLPDNEILAWLRRRFQARLASENA